MDSHAPANGAKETYKGVELSWQHFLENGLGAHLEVHSYLDRATRWPSNQAPPTTFSISLIYDKGPVQCRCELGLHLPLHLSTAHLHGNSDWPAITDPFSWVTASVHYAVF